MKKETIEILRKINTISGKAIENEKLLGYFIEDSFNGNPITFFNWECPPRSISKNQGKVFFNYDVNFDTIKKGEKIDAFTEIPRVIEKPDEEIKILEYFKNLGLKFKFVKLIADTNAYYLSPSSIEIIGEKKLKEIFYKFKKIINDEVSKYPVDSEVYLFSELIEKYKKEYEGYFINCLGKLKENPEELLDKVILDQQVKRTFEHTGLGSTEECQEFSLRTISSYAAEGMIFNLLSISSTVFSNCVWLNIEEADERTVAITNLLRINNNVGPLPMVFPKLKQNV